MVEAKEEKPKPEKKIKTHEAHTLSRSHESHKKQQPPTKLIVACILVVIGILFVVTISSGSISQVGTSGGTSPTNTQNCRQVQVPYTVQVLQQVTKYGSVQITNQNYVIPNLKYSYFTANIDISNKFSNAVSGSIAENSGHDINFYVFSSSDFNLWKNLRGNEAKPYVDLKLIQNSPFTFVPDRSDTYYFVLDNQGSIVTNKIVAANAVWTYQYTTTEYVDQTQYRTETQCG